MGLQHRPEFGQCNTSPGQWAMLYYAPLRWKRMVLQAGDLVLDTERRLLHPNGYGGEPIRLTPMESRLLVVLMESPGQIVSRADLMKRVWQTEFLDDTRTLDVHICWLRRKLEPDPAHPRQIVTHRGRGYQFCPLESEPGPHLFTGKEET